MIHQSIFSAPHHTVSGGEPPSLCGAKQYFGFFLTALISVVPVVGCYQSEPYKTPSRGYDERYPAGESAREEAQTFTGSSVDHSGESSRTLTRPPWEIWSFGYDVFTGAPLTDEILLRGDELVRRGKRKEAIIEYKKKRSSAAPPTLERARVHRLASVLISTGDAKQALAILGDHFRSVGTGAEEVDTYSSILFGYAYARNHDLSQSLAWFARAARVEKGSERGADSAAEGVRFLLRTLPSHELYALTIQWKNDLFVHRLIGQESKRRSMGGAQVDERELWAVREIATVHSQSGDQHLDGEKTVGVLLPLSGRYASLGLSTQEGMNLALIADGHQSKIDVVYKDTGDDAIQATANFEQLAAHGGVQVVIGPLFASSAPVIGNLGRERRLPVVALSKKTDFQTGGGVFRLAPTSESQVDSVLDACYRKLGIVQFASVYQEDEVGREFAEVFRRKVRELGLELTYEASYHTDDANSFLAIGDELRERQVGAIFFPGSVEGATRFLTSISDSLKQKIRLVGTAKWDDPGELSRSRNALEGAIFVRPFLKESTRPIVSQFIQSYQARYGKTPDFLAAQGFDAATLVVAALQRAANEEVPFEAALSRIDSYEGVTGRMRVDESGEIVRKLPVVEIRRGSLQEVLAQETPSFVYKGNYEETVDPNKHEEANRNE